MKPIIIILILITVLSAYPVRITKIRENVYYDSINDMYIITDNCFKYAYELNAEIETNTESYLIFDYSERFIITTILWR